MAYCEATDLIIGDLPTPGYIDKDQWLTAGQEEIDAVIGEFYAIPVNIQLVKMGNPQTALLLKRLNIYLSSGRLIMSIAIGGENKQLHAYGKALIDQALEVLKEIREGKLTLLGAQPRPGSAAGGNVNRPVINNLDDESYVEGFYRDHPAFATPFPTRFDIFPVGG